jgi:hypothetical protein
MGNRASRLCSDPVRPSCLLDLETDSTLADHQTGKFAPYFEQVIEKKTAGSAILVAVTCASPGNARFVISIHSNAAGSYLLL